MEALLFFGFHFHDDEFPSEWADDPDMWKHMLAQADGLDRFDKDYISKLRELLRHHHFDRIDVQHHNTPDDPEWYVTTKAFHASMGYPEMMCMEDLKVDYEDVAQLREFCEFFGFEYKGPHWWLAGWIE